MATLKVRQLIAVGTRPDDTGGYVPNQVDDEYEIADQPLDPSTVQPGDPATLVASYVAAGYVELVE